MDVIDAGPAVSYLDLVGPSDPIKPHAAPAVKTRMRWPVKWIALSVLSVTALLILA